MKEKVSLFLASPVTQFICRLILGGLFIYAGISKIAHPHVFAKIIHNYQLLPGSLVYLSAAILPWVEIVAGFLLVIGIFRRTSAIILSALLLVFLVAITFNVARGLSFDCGCFSSVVTESGSNPVGVLVRDILMLIPGAVIILKGKE